MHVLVAYDIGDDTVRNRIFAFLQDNGIHSQKSVFECDLDAQEIQRLKHFLSGFELDENDSIVIYQLCRRCASKCAIWGNGIEIASHEWLVV